MVKERKTKALLNEILEATSQEALKPLILRVPKEVDDSLQVGLLGIFIALKDHDIRLKDIESKLSGAKD